MVLDPEFSSTTSSLPSPFRSTTRSSVGLEPTVIGTRGRNERETRSLVVSGMVKGFWSKMKEYPAIAELVAVDGFQENEGLADEYQTESSG